MSQSVAKKSSTLGNEMRGATPKRNSSQNWRNVITLAETATRFEAGVVCIDLDSVILEHKPDDGSHLGRVLPLGRKFVLWWQKKGWRVIVLTARSRRHQEILGYLYRNGVEVERVTNRKPWADCYADDKAVRIPKNWVGEKCQNGTNHKNALRKRT